MEDKDEMFLVEGDDRDGRALLGDGGGQFHVLQQRLHGGVRNEVNSMSDGIYYYLWIFTTGWVFFIFDQGWLRRGGEHGRRRDGPAPEVDQRQALSHRAWPSLHGHRCKPTQAWRTQLRLLAAGERGWDVEIFC